MSSLIYPALPGLGFDVIRNYEWKTLLSEADSGVMTTVARRKYPIVRWEHTINVLRRNVATDELQQIIGLYNSLQGQFDTFLYTDPDFNTITPANMAQYGQFGVGTGAQAIYQLTATFENLGGPGGAEIIQNLNGQQFIYVNRYGLNELMSPVTRTNYLLQSQTWATTWTPTNATVTNAASIAPDGTTTACAVNETTANGVHAVQQTVTVPSATGDFTFTAYLKPNLTRTWAILQIAENTSSTSVISYFNLSGAGSLGATPTTGANWSNLRITITPANNGFYRCTIQATKTNAATSLTAYVYAATADNTNSYVGVAADGITGWGAQLEANVSNAEDQSTMYLPTTTAVATQADYTIGPTCIVTFTAAPALNALLSWAGSWYYRCRFEEDAIVWTKFMQYYWKAKIKFRSVKLS